MVFFASQSHAVSCKHETYDLLNLISFYITRKKIIIANEGKYIANIAK